MGKVASVALPIVGSFFGPIGAAIGGAIGSSMSGGNPVTGALTAGASSYFGGGLGTTGGGLFGDGGSAAAGGAGGGGGGGSIFDGGGGGDTGGFTALGGGGEAVGASGAGTGLALPAGVAGASDPIEGIDALLRSAPEGMGATQAAQSFGFGSAESLLGQANPAWTNTSPFFQGASNTMQDLGMPGAAKAFGGGFQGISDATGLSKVSNFLTGGGNPLAGQNRSPLGLVSGIGSIYSGLEARKQAKRLQELAQQEIEMNNANRTTDEMAPYRAGYAQELRTLMSDPSSLENTPGYQAGLQAINRSLAAQGFTGSGNAKTALLKYGGDAYNQQVARLQSLASGGGNNPSNSGAYNALASGSNLYGQGLASLGYGIRGLGY